MGIQINGQTDTITAIDGGLNVSGADLGSASAGSLNVTGIVTASGFSGNVTGNATGLSGNPNINVSTIGVNGATAQTPIDTISNSSGNGITVRGRSADGLGNIRFTSNDYATLYGGLTHNATNLNLFNERSGSLILGSNGINRVTIDSSGRVTAPYQPAFVVMPATDSQTKGNPVIFTEVHLNRGSHYNTSTGRFTAPVAGLYQFNANYVGAVDQTSCFVEFYLNGSQVKYGKHYSGIMGSYASADASVCFMNLNASDYVDLRIQASPGSNNGQSAYMHFAGCLIG